MRLSSHTFRKSLHEGGKVVSARHRPPLHHEILLVLISVRGSVDPRVIVRLEGWNQWKINGPIGNRTHDLLPCSAVPQPTAPHRAAGSVYIALNYGLLVGKNVEFHLYQRGSGNYGEKKEWCSNFRTEQILSRPRIEAGTSISWHCAANRPPKMCALSASAIT